MSAVPEQTFASGYKIPCVGLGTWKAKPEEVGAAVKSTVRLGYHHLDCALVYGNEKEIGKAIKECIDEGLVKREDLFITTKENAGLFPMIEDGLTDVIDIDFTETWTTMQDLVNQGLCRSIGVSNFNSKQIQRLIDLGLKHPISCNQVEISPYFSNEKLLQFCKSKDIGVVAHSPLGSADRQWLYFDGVYSEDILSYQRAFPKRDKNKTSKYGYHKTKGNPRNK